MTSLLSALSEKINPALPLSLYVHLPWCVRKCPYCDFNSHTQRGEIDETAYIQQLLHDLRQDFETFQLYRPTIRSIFFGGGTPSLFSANSYQQFFTGLTDLVSLSPNCEITLEANPGTTDQARFRGYVEAGINRLSIGVQSFNNKHLQSLGRIHSSHAALSAYEHAVQAGFQNINLDLMFGLPEQSLDEGLQDLVQAIALNSTHLSWYQLTLEPNTLFAKQPPALPDDDTLFELQQAGEKMLAAAGFHQYEVSAYAKPNKECQHNLNYWQFGDYLGIGAGAHGKLTTWQPFTIKRTLKQKHPTLYLTAKQPRLPLTTITTEKERLFEFMLNALRLFQPISFDLLEARTQLTASSYLPMMQHAVNQGWLQIEEDYFSPTSTGRRYLNDLVEIFL